ncbi:MAG: acetyl esterase [Planctomycetota bacterium]|jgi:acetyl esterase
MNRFLSMLLALSIGPLASAQNAAAKPDAAKPVAAELQAKAGVVYKTIGDVELRLYLLFPKGHLATDTRPAAVFYFGGGWNGGTVEQFKPHARYLASRGMVTAVCDYRVKQRHGTDPFACVADGKSAVRWLRRNAKRLGIDAKRIAAGGGSAGGHVAATTGVVPGLDEKGEDTAVSSKANALLLFNPVFDNGPGGYGHGRVKKRYREISPLHNIAKGAPPTIVFLGTKDKLIPVATAESYAAKMKEVGSRCDLHLYKGQPHGFFNPRNKKHYYLTVLEMDRFLISLGWLQGEPTIKKPAPGK